MGGALFGWIWARWALRTWHRPTPSALRPPQIWELAFFRPDSSRATCKFFCLQKKSRPALPGLTGTRAGKKLNYRLALSYSTYLRDSSFASRPFRTTWTTTASGRCRAPPRAVPAWRPCASGCSAPSSKWPRWRSSPQKQPLNFILYERTPRLSVSTLWFSNNGFQNKTIRSKQVGEHIGTVHSLSSLVKDVQRPERAKMKLSCYTFLMTPWAIRLSVSLHYFLKTKSFFFN